jgi:hypothetical protein
VGKAAKKLQSQSSWEASSSNIVGRGRRGRRPGEWSHAEKRRASREQLKIANCKFSIGDDASVRKGSPWSLAIGAWQLELFLNFELGISSRSSSH